MHLTLRTDDNEALHDWLRSEPDLRPLVKSEKRPPSTGELGAADVLTIAVGSGGALTVLAGSLGAWLARKRDRSVRIELRETKNGDRTVVLDARNTKPADIEAMLRAMRDGAGE